MITSTITITLPLHYHYITITAGTFLRRRETQVTLSLPERSRRRYVLSFACVFIVAFSLSFMLFMSLIVFVSHSHRSPWSPLAATTTSSHLAGVQGVHEQLGEDKVGGVACTQAPHQHGQTHTHNHTQKYTHTLTRTRPRHTHTLNHITHHAWTHHSHSPSHLHLHQHSH